MHNIPNTIHFIFGLEKKFGNRPFGLIQYISIRSAFEVNRPNRIYFYYRYKPSGYWWEMARRYLVPIKVSPPRRIYGRDLIHYAHKADVMRLMILKRMGGIYLDIDTVCIKPFRAFLSNKFVIGIQGTPGQIEGLCNAVMFSEKDATFVTRWLSEYKSFRSRGHDKYWCEHSVRLPVMLALDRSLQDERTILPYNFFHYPLYGEQGLKQLFEENHLFPEAFCHHLWESVSFKKYLKNITVHDVLHKNTTYNRIARKYLNNIKQSRIVTRIHGHRLR